MRRPLIIAISVLSAAIVIGAAGLGIWMLGKKESTQSPPATTTGQQQAPGGITQPTGSPTGSVVVAPSDSTDSVRASFEAAIAPYNTDNIKPEGNSTVVGEYAIQKWVGNNTGGEALLKYDSNKRTWTLVTGGGGQWGVVSLVYRGVPTSTAEALMAKLGR